jgi:RNA polymerase sigma-70 factor, ECF subfamily
MEGISVLENNEAVARAQAGDVTAFGELVACYQSRIVRYFYRMTGDIELARDLTQDTFLLAYKGLSKTTPNLPFRAWLYRIATNNVLQHYRKNKLPHSIRSDIDPRAEIGFGDNPDLFPESIEIQDMLLKVPEKFRACMVLHFIDGFKYREIALMLGISEDAVRMRVARGSEEFRKRFNAAGGMKNEVP